MNGTNVSAKTLMNSEIEKAVTALNKGGTILYPTDTIWGIGCDATNEEAIAKVYQIKRRDDAKSMIILVDTVERLKLYVDAMPKIAINMIQLAERPLTIIYPKGKNLPRNLINADGSIAIRVTGDEFCKNLIKKFDKPIISTSANISGLSYPGNFVEIDIAIKQSIDYIVNWRQEEQDINSPSNIIKLCPKGQITIIR